jgi:hypothetical protein
VLRQSRNLKTATSWHNHVECMKRDWSAPGRFWRDSSDTSCACCRNLDSATGPMWQVLRRALGATPWPWAKPTPWPSPRPWVGPTPQASAWPSPFNLAFALCPLPFDFCLLTLGDASEAQVFDLEVLVDPVLRALASEP